MSYRDATSWNEYSAIALAVRRVYELPAVPTLDWCERAAGAMTSLAPRSIARVWLVVATHTGVVLDSGDIGAADGRVDGAPRPIRGTLPHGTSLGWWIPSDNAPLRCRSARIDEVRTPSDPDAPRDRWWAAQAVELRIVGIAPIEPPEYGRHLAVEIGWAGTGAVESGTCVVQLEAVLRELSRRAYMAFGPEPGGPANRVTDREHAVLDMLALGHSVREIADTLARSPHTVHDHVKSLHRKLRVSTRGELIARSMGYMSATTGRNHLTGAHRDTTRR